MRVLQPFNTSFKISNSETLKDDELKSKKSKMRRVWNSFKSLKSLNLRLATIDKDAASEDSEDELDARVLRWLQESSPPSLSIVENLHLEQGSPALAKNLKPANIKHENTEPFALRYSGGPAQDAADAASTTPGLILQAKLCETTSNRHSGTILQQNINPSTQSSRNLDATAISESLIDSPDGIFTLSQADTLQSARECDPEHKSLQDNVKGSDSWSTFDWSDPLRALLPPSCSGPRKR